MTSPLNKPIVNLGGGAGDGGNRIPPRPRRSTGGQDPNREPNLELFDALDGQLNSQQDDLKKKTSFTGTSVLTQAAEIAGIGGTSIALYELSKNQEKAKVEKAVFELGLVESLATNNTSFLHVRRQLEACGKSESEIQEIFDQAQVFRDDLEAQASNWKAARLKDKEDEEKRNKGGNGGDGANNSGASGLSSNELPVVNDVKDSRDYNLQVILSIALLFKDFNFLSEETFFNNEVKELSSNFNIVKELPFDLPNLPDNLTDNPIALDQNLTDNTIALDQNLTDNALALDQNLNIL